MRQRILFLLFTVFSGVVFGYPNHSNQWSHRSLLYFAPSNDQHVEQFLLETHKHKCDLDSRDVVVLIITASGHSVPSWVKDQYDIHQLYQTYQVSQTDYISILIGKDGNEKIRFSNKIDWAYLNATIDGMPMRQQEMRVRNDPCSA